jgi:metal-responsive CopG/Arc/MetJ family transcriptional regulator
MKRISISLPAALHERLGQIASSRNLSMAEFIRQAVEAAMPDYEPLPRRLRKPNDEAFSERDDPDFRSRNGV